MARRSPKAAARFAAQYEPIALTNKEYHALNRAEKGYHVKAAMRKVLCGKGLVSSHESSKCIPTRKGRASLVNHHPLPERPALKAADSSPSNKREKWLKKHAPPFSRASAL